MFSANTSQVSGDRLYVEDVFSTYLYTGNDSTLEINNGIDLAGKGGLVWIKTRSLAKPNRLWDTARGLNSLSSNTNLAQIANLTDRDLTSFNSNGFSLGMDYYDANPPSPMASWTFRKAPKFFDVVTWTGNGVSGRTIAHNLGVAPGSIFVKRTDTTASWAVYHRSLSSSQYLTLNSDGAASSSSTVFTTTAPTSTDFSVGTSGLTNLNGATYVAYLFAHDTTSDGIIQCGSFTTDGSGNATVNLGWEPQWLLLKSSTAAESWQIIDNMRGWAQTAFNPLFPNLSNAESSLSGNLAFPTATGFAFNAKTASTTYIYIAIRRGPMRTPTSGTSVFNTSLGSSSGQLTVTTNFPSDLAWFKGRAGSQTYDYDRLRGNQVLLITTTDAESTGNALWDSNTAFRTGDTGNFSNWAFWNFRRAPSFFDVVCWTNSSSTSLTTNHSLGIVPEMVIVKRRGPGADGWMVRHKNLPSSDGMLFLNSAGANSTGWTGYSSTATTLTYDTYGNIGDTYVAYLFGTASGVSKVGSYTGNGSSQTINCGFAAGARFVMIKRTDSTGDWYVWDSARGIVAGNDPRLSLNSTAAEVTTDDSVDTDSSGFVVNQLSATNINVSSATYIYLAVA